MGRGQELSQLFPTNRDRLKRHEEKKQKLIQLLIEDRYIFFSNIAILFRYKRPELRNMPVRNFLGRMILSGDISIYVIKRKIADKFIKIELYYLTDLGLTRNLPPTANISKYRFTSSNLPFEGLTHRLETQRAMITLMNAGCCVQRLSFNEKVDYATLKKHPDFLFEKNGVRFAAEYERIPKEEELYHKNAGLHLTEIKMKHWDKVVYIFPEKTVRDRIKMYFERITEVQIGAETATAKRETIFSIFIFLTVDELEDWVFN